MMEATLVSYLGFCYLSSGRMEEAEYWTNKAYVDYEEISRSEEDPRIVEILCMRGQTLTRTSNFKSALITLEKGLQIAKDMFRSAPSQNQPQDIFCPETFPAPPQA